MDFNVLSTAQGRLRMMVSKISFVKWHINYYTCPKSPQPWPICLGFEARGKKDDHPLMPRERQVVLTRLYWLQ